MEQKSQKPDLVDSHETRSWGLSLSMLLWRLRGATTSKREETRSKIALLPYEVLLAIIELLDERSVACSLRTCCVLRDVAEPILYRHIQVYHDRGGEERPLKPYLLHRTLARRPDLLPGILSYHGPLIPLVGPDDASERSAASWFKIKPTTRNNTLESDEHIEKARIIFSGAINIQELHLTDVTSKDTAQVLGAFDAPQPKLMNVRKLVLNFQYSPELVAILRTMPGLKHLGLHRLRGGEIQLDETDLPELESLKADLQHAARIVPGRPIKKLELLHGWRPDQDQLWQRLTLSTCDITEFTTEVPGLRWAGDGVGEPEDLQAIARHLPRIARLCLRIPKQLSGSVLIEVLPAFSSLSHLKLLGEISGESGCSTFSTMTQFAYDPTTFWRFARELKDECPSLVGLKWSPTATYTCCDWETENLCTYRAPQ